MHPIFVLYRKSCLLFLKNKVAVVITFLVPIILIYLFGHVFGLYRTESGPSGIRIAVVNQSSEPAATELIDALRKEKAFRLVTEAENADGTKRPLTEADARAAMHDNKYRYTILLPPDLVRENAIGVHLKFLSDPRNEIESQMVNGLLQKTIFTNVPQLLGKSLQLQAKRLIGQENLTAFNRTVADAVANHFGGDREKIYQSISGGDFGIGALTSHKKGQSTEGSAGLRRLDTTAGSNPGNAAPAAVPASPTEESTTEKKAGGFLSRIVSFETEQVSGKQVSNPMAARTVGGYAVMFLLFALSGSATSLFEEKRSGIFQRILSAPVRPSHILWGRFFFGMTLGIVQLSALFLAGKLFYHLDLWPHLLPLAVMTFAAAAACTAFGMFVAAVSTSPDAANGLSTLLVLTMSAIGGAWFPISMMPEAIQRFSKLTLVYWAVEGYTSIIWAGQSLLEVLPTVGILLGIAVIVMLVATWCFQRNKMFE
ncbi:hypothetical protein DB347_00565 [Opitutaceae bacterium EW11]|nr:hypothetical protein DB347_00565 [Opitutaceae bacterium EW11]